MSKKEKNRVVNNIKELNLDIDYDKLADAIMKAQETVSNAAEKKERNRTRVRNAWMGHINGVLYYACSVITVMLIVGIWVTYSNGTNPSLILSILLTVLFAFFVVVSFMCGLETFKDNYQSTVTLFNTNVSLAALIVAIIALLKCIS